MCPWSGAELCVDALHPLEGTQRFIQPAVAATHGSAGPLLAVQDTTARPHVLCDQERLQTHKRIFWNNSIKTNGNTFPTQNVFTQRIEKIPLGIRVSSLPYRQKCISQNF